MEIIRENYSRVLPISIGYLIIHYLTKIFVTKRIPSFHLLKEHEKKSFPERITSIVNLCVVITISFYGTLFDKKCHDDPIFGSSPLSIFCMQVACSYFLYECVLLLISIDFQDKKGFSGFLGFFMHGLLCFAVYFLSLVKKKQKKKNKKIQNLK